MVKKTDKSTEGETISRIIEIVRHEKYFFEERPEILNSEYDQYAKMALVDAYGLIFTKGREEPVLFVRHGNTNSYRFGGCCRLSNDSVGVQTPLHDEDMAQKEETGEFRALSEEPWIYGYGTEKSFSEYRYFYENGLINGTWKEGDFLDVKAEPFPYCIVQHMGDIANFTQIMQPAIVKGTFDGEEVKFLGSFDKVFMPSKQTSDIGSTMAYNLVLDHGIRQDGRKESFIVYINAEGKGMGMYYLEGEEPIVSEEVIMETEWFHQPYSDDGTVMYKDALFIVGNKKIHFEGKWGAKGVTAKPRFGKHGQSQIFGTWYEGKERYRHRVYYTFTENMEAYDENLKSYGFDVKD